jgi:RNA polymerase sigma-70 factor (ECF subfamily)
MHRSRHARFGLLVDGYSADLYRYAAWLCGDRAMAEDLVQETFMRAWRSLGGLRKEGAAKAWLFALLKREHAREYVRPRESRDETDYTAGVSRHDGDTEALLLRRALAALTPEYRESLVLQVMGGFSCVEIANILEIAPRVAMSRIFRARKYLRDTLSDERLDRSNKVMA